MGERMKDITPDNFRCCLATCPGVFKEEAQTVRYALRGKIIQVDGDEALIEMDHEMVLAALKADGAAG